jgi:hypothetical protein
MRRMLVAGVLIVSAQLAMPVNGEQRAGTGGGEGRVLRPPQYRLVGRLLSVDTSAATILIDNGTVTSISISIEPEIARTSQHLINHTVEIELTDWGPITLPPTGGRLPPSVLSISETAAAQCSCEESDRSTGLASPTWRCGTLKPPVYGFTCGFVKR